MYNELIKVITILHKNLVVVICFLVIPTSPTVTVTTKDGGEEDPIFAGIG